MDESPEKIFFNGINAVKGSYLLPPLTDQEFAKIAQQEPLDQELSDRLVEWVKDWVLHPEDDFRAPVTDVEDPSDLSQTGWAVVFPQDIDPDIRNAMEELLELRREEAGAIHDHYYQEFAYRPGESKLDFLDRRGADLTGPANPEQVPYYVLLVGDPETIPFHFQYDLDVQYAVGRIHFEKPEDYFNYSRSVVQAERLGGRARRLSFFGVKNPHDPATEGTLEELIVPLADRIKNHDSSWQVDQWLASQANRLRLESLLSGKDTPALLFAACHGMAFPLGDPRQIKEQGALICQEWPGPENGNAVERSHYFAAEDLPCDADLTGLIAFLYACHSAGTPGIDTFGQNVFSRPGRIAPRDFLSRLPQRLLSQAKGGAMAVVGHIDRGWTTSFRSRGRGGQINAFDSTLKCLLDEMRLGAAMEYLNQRYAELGAALSGLYGMRDRGEPIRASHFSHLWRSTHDARNLVVFGDPAVRLSAQDILL